MELTGRIAVATFDSLLSSWRTPPFAGKTRAWSWYVARPRDLYNVHGRIALRAAAVLRLALAPAAHAGAPRRRACRAQHNAPPRCIRAARTRYASRVNALSVAARAHTAGSCSRFAPYHHALLAVARCRRIPPRVAAGAPLCHQQTERSFSDASSIRLCGIVNNAARSAQHQTGHTNLTRRLRNSLAHWRDIFNHRSRGHISGIRRHAPGRHNALRA